MVKISFGLLCALMLFLSGCAEHPATDVSRPVVVVPRKPTPPKPEAQHQDTGSRDVFVVNKGDTLYSIGFGSGYGYELLAKWNNIPKPYRLNVGQVIKLYDPTLHRDKQVVTAKRTHAPNAQQPNNKINKPQPPIGSSIGKGDSATVTVVPTPKPPVSTASKHSSSAIETSSDSKGKEKNLKLYWKWPIQGKILKTFIQSGNKGIDIEGNTGDLVHAAAGGEVVYSGNGLIGYGNLLIIKHDDMHLSAYANNASLQVNEGQKVTAGDRKSVV